MVDSENCGGTSFVKVGSAYEIDIRFLKRVVRRGVSKSDSGGPPLFVDGYGIMIKQSKMPEHIRKAGMKTGI